MNADHLKVAGGKLAAGPGVTMFGMMTLNDVALIAGILCSIAIFAHTILKAYWDWQDRQARRAGRWPEDE